MQFVKMHGAGNDYVFVDCFARPAPSDPAALARDIADRHFGVGGDGLILICPADHADAEMRMFNADGSPAEMCGNGIRCVAKYLYDRGIAAKEQLSIRSAGRLFEIQLQVCDRRAVGATVDMGEPVFSAERIPTTLGGEPIADAPVVIGNDSFGITCLSMCNPHCVVFVETLSDDLVCRLGPKLEVDSRFPKRTNVEFVEVLSACELRQRTWERGTGETLACGTGASAVCVAGALTGRSDREVLIHLVGGDLRLHWRQDNNHVTMTGPAEEVFVGEWPDD